MVYYAALDSDNICIGISQLSGKGGDETLIEVEEYNVDLLYRKYENGVWSEEKFIPEVQVQKSEAEKIQDSILAFQEAFATKYEEDIETNIKRDEVLATIYETILEGNE